MTLNVALSGYPLFVSIFVTVSAEKLMLSEQLMAIGTTNVAAGGRCVNVLIL